MLSKMTPVRFDLAQTLEAEGYKTFEAADAAEAIAVLEANPEIRVVFTDIQMPGTMDGLALVSLRQAALATDYHCREFRAVLPEPDEMPSGAVFMPKPYAPEVLAKVLDDIRQRLAVSELESVAHH